MLGSIPLTIRAVLACIGMFTTRGCDGNIVTARRAAGNNHCSTLKLLALYGGDVNARNNHGNTPLHLACQNNLEKVHKQSNSLLIIICRL